MSSPLLHISVNPPRKAKRPLPQQFIAESSEEEEDDFDPEAADVASVPAQPGGASASPKKRGRRTNALSRSAREQARKQNHSKIEKRRRVKINETLTTLKQLVPSEFKAPSSASSAALAVEGQREFKLEILEKTAAYMRYLIERVEWLEGELGPKAPPPELHQPPSPLSLAQNKGASTSPVLPPISSWINTVLAPSHASPHAQQLPSPPSSSRTHPTASEYPPPPNLSLASPPPSDEHDAASALASMSAKGSPPTKATGDGARIQTPATLLGLEMCI